jgi:hypothetical protein
MPHLRLKYKDLDVSFRLDKAEEAASQLRLGYYSVCDITFSEE